MCMEILSPLTLNECRPGMSGHFQLLHPYSILRADYDLEEDVSHFKTPIAETRTWHSSSKILSPCFIFNLHMPDASSQRAETTECSSLIYLSTLYFLATDAKYF